VNFSFRREYRGSASGEDEWVKGVIEKGYCVNMPIPIGCRWCSLQNYDYITQIRSGEESDAYRGAFIIEGNARHILPMYRKPFNRNVIVQNRFDNQLSRSEGIYTNKFLYEESYYIVGSMVEKRVAHTGRGGRYVNVPDFGLSLQLNHPWMNQNLSFDRKKSREIINFVPIRYIFAAFGCLTDDAMLHYICPEMDDNGLIHAISNACLLGYAHRDACQTAGIRLRSSNYIIYAEPLTPMIAKYIIGCIIFTQNTRQALLQEAKNNEIIYKSLVAQAVDAIFDERFMPGIQMDGDVAARNVAICTEVGMMVKHLYLIGRSLEESQDRRSMINRRVRSCQQILYEYKAFHNARYREVTSAIVKMFAENSSGNAPLLLTEMMQSKIAHLMQNVGKDMSRSMVNSFKMTSKERSKMRTDILTPKNAAFVANKFREIVISPDMRKEGSTVSWDHRAIHNSELFFICPTQTPEAGTQTGRFKTPTIYTYITIQTPPDKIFSVLQANGDIRRMFDTTHIYYIIRVNGSIYGYIPELEPVEKMYEVLMNARRDSSIEVDASITLNHTNSTLDIWTDSGRIVSPFAIVSRCFELSLREQAADSEAFELHGDIHVRDDFRAWLEACAGKIDQYRRGITEGYIEYFCPEMAISNAVIAPSMKEFIAKPFTYTHVALPNHIHGLIASLIPAVSLDAHVKASLATNYVKQAIGNSLRYPMLKYIVEMNILIAPEVPILRTCTYNHARMNETPYGQNVIVCFMHFSHNQEDAVVLNQASVDSGLLKIDSMHSVMYKIDKNDEEFTVPTDITLTGNPASYGKLNPQTALPSRVGERFSTNDVIIGKIAKTDRGNIDTSILNTRPDGKYPISANARYTRNIVRNAIHDENRVYKMTAFGQFRHMLTGDKENSDHGQKGTCGLIMPPSEMPYTSSGLVPDIIFDPDAVLHRNTFGQIDIPAVSTIACLLGCQLDHTSYHSIRSVEDIQELLVRMGLSKHLKQTMYDGKTGMPYLCDIFIGVHYWERQLHLVEQKLNVRWDGPRIFTTNQPLKGKRRGGGQSIDRMSFDSHTASGICEIQRDMHLNQGSSIAIGCCDRCHECMAYYNKNHGQWCCQRCGLHHEIAIRDMPPATNLLNHALVGLHIGLRYYSDLTANSGDTTRAIVESIDLAKNEEEEDDEDSDEDDVAGGEEEERH
jgi:DNA-directed RNA polymerase beta subunit